MKPMNRRKFLDRTKKAAAGVAASAAVFSSARSGRAVSPNEKTVIAAVGIRGRGHLLAMGFALRGDCEIAYMCDVDQRNFSTAASAGYMRFTPPELAVLPRLKGVEEAQGKPAKPGRVRACTHHAMMTGGANIDGGGLKEGLSSLRWPRIVGSRS